MNISDYGYWHIKVAYDLLGYMAAFIITLVFYKKVFHPGEMDNPFLSKQQKIDYYLYVISWAFFGWIFISTLDGILLGRSLTENGIFFTKSIAWALFWWIITAELFKHLNKIKTSTGILFLPGIVIGVLVGRVGAIMTGLRDFTYGQPTNLPWGMNFWDGIPRHPTMIYEMLLLAIFFVIFCNWLYSQRRKWWIRNGFYSFIIVYFVYRFLVGFIQPYSHFWLGLSTYQIIAIPMVWYGWWMIRKR